MSSTLHFSQNYKGLALALGSSAFIGASFIIKKKGLQRSSLNNSSAADGGHMYLLEPLWWLGMITMVGGEAANFAALAFAPAILVTPLGALSIIVSAVLAQIFLKERLHKVGIAGCCLIILGATVIVLHAPPEQEITGINELWKLATTPAFLWYMSICGGAVLLLMLYFSPKYGSKSVFVYIGICSLMGSLSVICAKAIGIALKLSVSGKNQFTNWKMVPFTIALIICVLVQLNYLNKALDTFNTAVVSPIYYAMFTSFTILASAVMFRDWENQSVVQIATAMCGFCVILGGTYLLHTTKDFGDTSPAIGGYPNFHSDSMLRRLALIRIDENGLPVQPQPVPAGPPPGPAVRV